MINSYDKKKILLFNNFAKAMSKKKIKWIVIGGLDNFPNKLGRDLDIILQERKNIKIVQKIFINCLIKLKIKSIILKNKKFYGDVVCAFDKDFNYYELDIKHPILRSSFFSIAPNWKKPLLKIGNFYTDPSSYAFKNYFSTRKNKKKKLNHLKNIEKPYWLKLYVDYYIKNKNFNLLTFFFISVIYIFSNPVLLFVNLVKGLHTKIAYAKYEHAPIFFIKNKKIEKVVLKYVNQYLLVFKGVKCIENNFYLRNAYSRFYKKNNENLPSKFIFNLFFFIRSFIDRNKFEKMNFLYTLNKKNNFKTCHIDKPSKKFILTSIIHCIKKIENQN